MLQGPFDRLFRDIHRSGIRGDRFDIAYGLRDPESKGDPDDEPWDPRLWDREQSVWGTIAGLLGVSFAAVIGYFPLGFTIFVAPLPAILAVYLVWIVCLRVAVRQRPRHPWLVLAIPLTTVVAWAALMWIGWNLLHWPPLVMPGLT